jgi:hypothetical protein
MPLPAAVMVVNHRHGTTETRVVPLAVPPLWPIIARSVGAALRAVRSLLDRSIAARPHRARPGGCHSRRVGSDRRTRV